MRPRSMESYAENAASRVFMESASTREAAPSTPAQLERERGLIHSPGMGVLEGGLPQGLLPRSVEREAQGSPPPRRVENEVERMTPLVYVGARGGVCDACTA